MFSRNEATISALCKQPTAETVLQLRRNLKVAVALSAMEGVLDLSGRDSDNYDNMRGLRILELGCGSEMSGWFPYNVLIYSIFARGGVVGLDIEPQSKRVLQAAKNAKFLQLDLVNLVKNDQLSALGRGYDIVESDSFLLDGTPGFSESCRGAGMSEPSLVARLKDQMPKMLKPGGKFIIDQKIVYEK